jgi:hypothetical protein
VDNELSLQLVKAGHGTDHDTVGELARDTFIGNDMRHISQVAYSKKIHDASLPTRFLEKIVGSGLRN